MSAYSPASLSGFDTCGVRAPGGELLGQSHPLEMSWDTATDLARALNDAHAKSQHEHPTEGQAQ